MKKLVKTARQCFEERLNQLTIFEKYKLSDTDIYYMGMNQNDEMSILREIHDEEFYEHKYDCSYAELVLSESFLCAITERFIEHHSEPLKPLFDWYASADKCNEPFTLDDIWMCNLEEEDLSVVFSDLYEEVPDVRIITAKEQWENDSKDFTTQENEGDYPFKVVIDDESLRFYYYEYGYYCNIYPSLESLRKDDIFIKDVTDRLLEFANYEGVGKLQHWIRFGGEFPLSFGWIFYSEYPRTDVIEYEDQELPQEQTIEDKYFSTEIAELKERMIDYIVEIYNKGLRLKSSHFLENSYAINWASGSYYDCANIKCVYLRETLESGFEFSYECKYDAEGDSSDSRLEDLSIETLYKIIDAMR